MLSKFALAAGVSLALAFTLGCGEHSFEDWLGLSSDSSSDSLSSSSRSSSSGGGGNSSSSLSSSSITYNINEEMKLYNIMMEYRAEKGLPPIPLSKSLTHVAKTHLKDLHENFYSFNDVCNGHSWSNNGCWTYCCYTPDHARAACMWDKPRELTFYAGNGYEIAFEPPREEGYTVYAMTAEAALNGWKGSPLHNAVVVNEGSWKNVTWKAIGIGIFGGLAAAWFGEEPDECEGECEKEAECELEGTDYKWCLIESYYGTTVCKKFDADFTLEDCRSLLYQPRENPPDNCIKI